MFKDTGGDLTWLHHRIIEDLEADAAKRGWPAAIEDRANRWENKLLFRREWPNPDGTIQEEKRGLRPPQLGALHAIGSHWSLQTQTGTVVMPTGTGKTETMLAALAAYEDAWTFSNWLTHTKSGTWVDADMAQSLLQHAIGMATSLLLRALRGVPAECPKCGSPDLEPQQGENCEAPGVLWERPVCAECGWAGRPLPILDIEDGEPILTREGEESDDCSIMTVPLRTILKPGDPKIEPLKDTETGPPEHVVYFAYGSNMSTARLSKRMPSCKPLGVATLPDHVLRFHKRSTDGSAKCNAFASSEEEVIGVLFSFDPAERVKLDEVEGLGKGYEHQTVTVINDKGRRRKVLTYIATPGHIDDGLNPYTWYKDHVLAGAREHGLPPEYIAASIDPVEATDDPDKKRELRERSTLGTVQE